MLRIGVDVGGTKVAYGLFDEDGKLLDRRRHFTPIDTDGPGLSEMILQNMYDLIEKNKLSESDIKGVGIGMPSFVNYDKGYINLTTALTNIRDFPMRDWFRARTNIPVLVDNDTNCAALAEHKYGAGRGFKHLIYMAASTGIGSGLILNGDVFRGSYGGAGETGHMLITPDRGVECGCGNKGCIMSWAAGRYIPQQLRIMGKNRETMMDMNGALDGIALQQACNAGDPFAMEFLDQVAHYIAICCYNIYQTLNVNLYVFGGGLTNFGDMLFDRVRAEFDRYNHIDLPVYFRFAELGQDFGIIGAAEMIR